MYPNGFGFIKIILFPINDTVPNHLYFGVSYGGLIGLFNEIRGFGVLNSNGNILFSFHETFEWSKNMKNDNKNQTRDYQDEELVSLADAARFINMSKSFLKTVRYRNEIPFYQLGGRVRFKIADLKRFIETCRVENAQKGSVDDAARQ